MITTNYKISYFSFNFDRKSTYKDNTWQIGNSDALKFAGRAMTFQL